MLFTSEILFVKGITLKQSLEDSESVMMIKYSINEEEENPKVRIYQDNKD